MPAALQPGPMPRSTHPPRGSLAPLLAALLALLSSCLGPPGPSAAPVAEPASLALSRARARWRSGATPADPELLAALAEARALEPGWVAPRRFEDDLARASHREVAALEARRDEALAAPDDGGARYLLARLEGTLLERAFAEVVALEPSLAWGWHGLAVTLDGSAEVQRALRAERRAVDLARDPWERAYFTLACARVLDGARRREEALALLREALEELPLEPADRSWLATETALLELRSEEEPVRAAGYDRGLELVREDATAEHDIHRLVAAMRSAGAGVDPGARELELALTERSGEAAAPLLADLWLDLGRSALVRAALSRGVEGGGDEALAARVDRLAAFRLGAAGAAVREWLADLPAQVLGDDALPADPCLRRVVELAGALGEDGPSAAESRRLFGEALLEAGWFDEAREVAEALAPQDLAAALSLRERAVAADLLLARIAEVVTGEGDAGAGDAGAGGAPVDLDELLGRLAPLFARCDARFDGTEVDLEGALARLAATPRQDYGPIATVLHPGPRFSAADEAAGLGGGGEAVGGLAAELARYGRFGLFGKVLGSPPDGTVLRRLLVEEREGEHLGVAWSGTVAWCEGADLPAAPARRGARLAGAALHEGYWLDVAAVREERDRWRALASELDGAGAAGGLAEILAERGLRLRTPPSWPERRRAERRAVEPVLGEADRVRLAVLHDRRSEGEGLGRLPLADLVRAVAVHEEGHLCDRTRFLPLEEHLGEVLGLLLECGLSARAVQRRLEYRAQLTALGELPDPRLALVELLDAAEAGEEGVLGGLPHGEAYTELLADLLECLDEDLERDPGRWPSLDPERTLLHQLHALAPEELRGLALRLAKREGLVSSTRAPSR